MLLFTPDAFGVVLVTWGFPRFGVVSFWAKVKVPMNNNTRKGIIFFTIPGFMKVILHKAKLK